MGSTGAQEGRLWLYPEAWMEKKRRRGGGEKTGGKITTSEPPQLGASKKGTKLGMMTDRQRHRRAAGHWSRRRAQGRLSSAAKTPPGELWGSRFHREIKEAFSQRRKLTELNRTADPTLTLPALPSRLCPPHEIVNGSLWLFQLSLSSFKIHINWKLSSSQVW